MWPEIHAHMCEMSGVFIVSQNQTSTVLLASFPGPTQPGNEATVLSGLVSVMSVIFL